jgi:hypothetical protein
LPENFLINVDYARIRDKRAGSWIQIIIRGNFDYELVSSNSHSFSNENVVLDPRRLRKVSNQPLVQI